MHAPARRHARGIEFINDRDYVPDSDSDSDTEPANKFPDDNLANEYYNTTENTSIDNNRQDILKSLENIHHKHRVLTKFTDDIINLIQDMFFLIGGLSICLCVCIASVTSDYKEELNKCKITNKRDMYEYIVMVTVMMFLIGVIMPIFTMHKFDGMRTAYNKVIHRLA